MSTAVPFNDVRELLEAAELVDIVTYKFAGELSEADVAQPLAMRVLTRCADGE